MADAAQWGEAAKALAAEGRHAEAEAKLREGLAALPGHPVLSYALGCYLLQRGAYAEGWRLYEYRGVLPRGPRQPQLSFPQWRGGPVKSLVVLPEQGFGDQLLFARWLPVLARRGIAATLVTPPALAGLLAPLAEEVIPVEGEVRIPPRDAWVYAGSLPLLTALDDPPPCLAPGRGGGGIGLMLRGGAQFDGLRSLTPQAAARLRPLGRSLHPDDTGAPDFLTTAAIVAGLDLVITVDTSVAALAAAMGKPAWVMLRRQADWRWGQASDQAPLFPGARLFRQTRDGDWDGVVDAVLAALPPRPGRA
ncbi:MAG: hypothetical protein JNL41_08485 [Phenylobacterium sp.]|uniref:hypothetical protein n=1 Tax=Phenylobacterium sp. TaxID=1871053 RepID=UPI001A63AC83|nr:hypothetical protein [Phenylobacterium sp.]MBL8554301.1 hypothetical protein [Phenylobacterium sp.]